jgi:hypothetical protein
MGAVRKSGKEQVNYVFLDIDGVLNDTTSTFVKIGPTRDRICLSELDGLVTTELSYLQAYMLRCTNPVSVSLMNKLLAHPDIHLVLSSSHRFYLVDDSAPYGGESHLSRLATYLNVMGLRWHGKLTITPKLHRPRGEEVQAYIMEHGEPTQYVVIDDSAEFSAGTPLVLCDSAVGFTFERFTLACKFLGCVAPTILL